MKKQSDAQTSWEGVKGWYDDSVGKEGHYYHRQIIFPKLLKSWNLKNASVVDLACGQGVLARQIPSDVPYLGLDVSPSLIKAAKLYNASASHRFEVCNLAKPLPSKNATFTHAATILAFQNIESPLVFIQNAASLLKKGGCFSLVINHPYFRIPRQTSWGVDESKKIQYRRVDAYMSSFKIPIRANPGHENTPIDTLSYHYPLSDIVKWLNQSGFLITAIEEWCSDKVSTGAKAKMENRARNEFPLFMHILCTRS